MKNLIKIFASLMLVFGLVATGNAASIISSVDSFKVHQTDTEQPAGGAGAKKGEGEEEEPDC